MHPLPGIELENDPEDNPCFGCGPRNPVGLRLRYFDDGEWIRAALNLDDRYCGWPGEVTEGILFTALHDATYWTAWARFGRLPRFDARVEMEHTGDVRTDEPFTVEARALEAEGEWTRFEARCVQEGEAHARLVRRMRPRTDEELKGLLQYPRLPGSIREDVERVLKA